MRSSRLSTRYKIWSLVGLGVVGFAFVGAGRDGGRGVIVPMAAFWVVIVALVMFAFAIGNYTRRTAIGAALGGALLLTAIAAVVYAME